MSFRRRRFRRRFSRTGGVNRRKTDGDWVVAYWNEASAEFDGADYNNGILFPLITPDDLQEHDDNLTVHRLIGRISIVHRYAGDPVGDPNFYTYFLHERIGVGTYDLGGDIPLYPANTINTFDQANESFLWHRVRPFNEITSFRPEGWIDAGSRIAVSSATDIDLRVRRRILPGQFLAYALKAPAQPLEHRDVYVNLFLRAWVKF